MVNRLGGKVKAVVGEVDEGEVPKLQVDVVVLTVEPDAYSVRMRGKNKLVSILTVEGVN